jgi:hypothetical protein
VDIAAPGEYLSAAYYGGETGGNGTTDNPAESGPGPTGLPDGPLGGSDYYSRGDLSGTSYAAPTVAGGAALLYDAAYSVFSDNADARDARVMKAVLMNSADKTFGWNNGQITHPNGNGGVLTTQGLDNRVGTGRLNLAAAYDQFLTGTTDIAGTSSGDLGVVNDVGWDFGQVVSGTMNDYFFNSPLLGGTTFTATLTWFRDRRLTDANFAADDSYDDLNLELWSVVGGIPASLISESSSLYNESEHFSFSLPTTGEYALRVRWFKEVFDRVADTNQELYGLAWRTSATISSLSIPEPASGILLITTAMAIGASRHARRGPISSMACKARNPMTEGRARYYRGIRAGTRTAPGIRRILADVEFSDAIVAFVCLQIYGSEMLRSANCDEPRSSSATARACTPPGFSCSRQIDSSLRFAGKSPGASQYSRAGCC